MKAYLFLSYLFIAPLHGMQPLTEDYSALNYNYFREIAVKVINQKQRVDKPEILHIGYRSDTIIRDFSALLPAFNHMQVLEKSEERVSKAKENNPFAGTRVTIDRFDEDTNDRWPFSNQYDFIFSFAYLNWTKDQEKLFDHMAEWLAKDGTLLLETATRKKTVQEWCEKNNLKIKEELIIQHNEKGLSQLVLVATKPYRSDR